MLSGEMCGLRKATTEVTAMMMLNTLNNVSARCALLHDPELLQMHNINNRYAEKLLFGSIVTRKQLRD